MSLKTNFVDQFRSKNLRPFSGLKDSNTAEIPPLYLALKASGNLKSQVNNILESSFYEKKDITKSITALDLRSTDNITTKEIISIRSNLLSPNKLSCRARRRYHSLLMHKKFIGLDGWEHTFPSRDESARAIMMLLGEFYQLAVLGMIKDWYVLSPEQQNRVFKSLEEFDIFVASLSAWIDIEKRSRYSRLMDCCIIRSMVNVHDTLVSERYDQVYEDKKTLVEKLGSKLIIKPRNTRGHYDVELIGLDGFRWILAIDEKTFDSINKKKKSNRNYGNTEAMADLLRMRFEPNDLDGKRDEAMMLRAIDYFAKHIFSGSVELKSKGSLIKLESLTPRKNAKTKIEPLKATTVTSLNNVAITGNVAHGKEVTGKIECQFQFNWEMTLGINSTGMYDLKKDLTASARDLGSIDIQNILFMIRRMKPEKIGMTEQEILDHLFLPDSEIQNTSSQKRTPQEQKEVKAKLSQIERVWGKVGFLFPVRAKNGGVRFITRMSFSEEMFTLYPEQYTPAPWIPEKSPAVLSKMVSNADNIVNTRLQEYNDRIARTEPMRITILKKYINDWELFWPVY